ncbi:hypothetical protein M8C21_008140 [Ambrosia artemisiifolia]|uniref:Receptor-like serine/threonine-protein kinase n=1 Tax=Ambrosia artemisiifolia TaxID=4212 RepID=A0AAD5BUQ0_AMBAR|nr:hypothetical protein M8C21_008140 [Ambrosia artemisiifolia]
MERSAIFLFCLLFIYKTYAVELQIISDSSFLTDGDTLVSAARIFELGFFKPGSSENRYLGIWYKNISVRTVVWVANRHYPLLGASPLVLKITDQGTLGLFKNSSIIWSSNTTTSGNTYAKLRDNGNLVVVDPQERVIWQSFDYLTDTLLPGMKLGRDYLRGKEWHLSSWKSSQDPAPGELTWGANTLGYPELKLRQGALVKFRGTPWRNQSFNGLYAMGQYISKPFTYDVVINEGEVSVACNLEHSSNLLIRSTVNSSGRLESWAWVEKARGWQPVVSYPRDTCDTYNICNAYGTCSMYMNKQTCKCLDEKRFVPKNQKGWDTEDWSAGCIRRTPLECKNGLEEFIKYSNVKLPDTENTLFNMSITLEECHKKCLQNCTCMAYANPDDSQSICLLWFGDLLDIQVLPEGSGGPDIFVRMATSELDSQSISKKKQGGAKIKIILLVIIPGVLLVVLIIATWLCCSRRIWNHAKPSGQGESLFASKSQEEDMEQPLFSFSTIANATANFSPENKLGQGGFGPVYKGTLEEGQEIAVKRLSKNSSQGFNEFKNEVICISKLQHRNLVKILGCCIEGDENGYMSPEYALDGLFSIKSDVFSFGVLVLEIVSGKRNRGFVQSENETNFIAYVWGLYNEGRSMDIADLSCVESCHPDEVIRSIKVGLLCVQHNAGDRPHMSSVIQMLGGEGEPPQPKQPSFFMESQLPAANFSSSTYTEGSLNNCTNTEVDAR